MPVKTPKKPERTAVGSSFFISNHGSVTLSLIEAMRSASASSFSIRRNTCGIENRPISATVNGMPENRLMLSSVKRAVPVVEMSRPMQPASKPLIGEPCESEARIVMPSTATAVSSTGPNITAILPSRGATESSTVLEMTPPTNEANSDTPRACPASPRAAIG